MFCAKCDDFIYDPELERIRDKLIQDAFKGDSRKHEIQLSLTLKTASKKRKANALVAPIKPTVLKPVLCRKGMPKGLYNLGHSCYLNVILQAMARTSLLSNYLLRSKHGLENCAETHCVACGLTRSLRQMLATDKEDGHGPVALLYVSWQKSSVSSDSPPSRTEALLPNLTLRIWRVTTNKTPTNISNLLWTSCMFAAGSPT